ncbi:hypothetical protein [Accumulibacter sp.]|uniref:hypothetical protein n=1 Tax=Accumulibacter sp. TaxID=2053492 RepID=UPI00260AAC55|nr:hypothetical protein [Accumulibacter sp.]
MKVGTIVPERLAVRLVRWLLSSFLAFGVCRADVPNPAQECRLRNAAICEVNGVRHVVDGPCPAAARTIRPPGDERCEGAEQGRSRGGSLPAARTAVAQATESGSASTPTRDLAWVGRVERWLLPLLLAVGGLLLCGLALLLVRWRRASGHAGKAPSNLGRWLLQLVVAAACAVPLGYLAAQLAFQRVFSSADNHDTALPWLLAAPLAVVVFTLVTGLAFAVVALLLGLLLKGRDRPGGHPDSP